MIARIKGLLMVFVVVALATACTAHNTMVSSSARAKDHQAGEHVNKVMVVAVVNDKQARDSLESNVVAALKAQGVEAAASAPVLGDHYSEGKTRKQMAADIASKGYEAALVISVIDIKEEMHYTQGGTHFAPDIAVSGAMGQTYYVRQNATYEPGYFSNDKKYFLESNLYRLQPEGLLWRAKSTTVNPSDLQAGTTGVADAVVDRMAKDDMI